MPLTEDAFDRLAPLGLPLDLDTLAPRILSLLPIGLQIDDASHCTVYVNRGFTNLFGYELADIQRNDDWFEKVYPDPAYRASVRAVWEERTRTAIESDALAESYERIVRCKDGSDKVVEFNLRRVGDYFIYLYIDVSARHELAAELRRLAHTDELTGLANRRCFFEIGTELIRSTLRPLSVLTFDIDHFKAVNDGRGHAAGDHVLVEVATRVRAILAPGQTLARLGGEEFGILLPGCGESEARIIAERLRTVIAHRSITLAAAQIGVTVSVGGACAPGPVGDLDALLLRADHALYAAKRAGRDKVRFAPR